MSVPQQLPFHGRIHSSPQRINTAAQAAAARQPITAAVTRNGMALVVKWSRPYPPYRAALQHLLGCRWDRRNEVWLVHVAEIRRVRELVARFGWHTSPQVDAIPDLAPEDFPILIRSYGEQLVVELPWREDIHPTLLENEARLDPSSGLWFVPAEKALDTVLDLQKLTDVQVRIDGDLGAQIEKAIRMLALSRAMEASPDFKMADTIARDLSNRPFQIAGVEYGVGSVLAGLGGCFLWGTMGCGKTAVALAILETLDRLHDFPTFPLIVVPPAGIKTNWVREVRAVLPHRSTYVCEGMKPSLPLEEPDIWIVNYDILGKLGQNSWADVFADVDFPIEAAVFDEGHRLKELRVIRSRACQAISTRLPQRNARLLLTGTPVRNRREEVVPQLVVIGRGGELPDGTVTTQFGNVKALKKDENLSRRLRTVCAWRPDPVQVLRHLGLITDDESGLVPENFIVVDGDPKTMADYRHAEERFFEYLRNKAEDEARRLGLDPHAAGVRAVMKAGSAAQLMQINELCRLAGKAKIPAGREWVSDFMTTGEKLLVFAHHRDVMTAVANDRIPQIHGDVKHQDRMLLVDRFQDEPGFEPLQAMVLQIEAAGEGLTLTKAWHTLHVEIEWVPGAHDQANARAAWRMNDPHNILANYLVCADTIDETRIMVLQAKRAEMALVTGEGREALAKESTYGAVFEQLLRRALGEEA